jgi:hypothetical protein
MRIVTTGDRLRISDNPYGFWAFDSMFVLGGITALSLSLIAAPTPMAAVVGSVVGLANLAGGVYMIKKEPASIVELDRGARHVRVRRWGVMGNAAKSYPLDALLGAEIETTRPHGRRPGPSPEVCASRRRNWCPSRCSGT